MIPGEYEQEGKLRIGLQTESDLSEKETMGARYAYAERRISRGLYWWDVTVVEGGRGTGRKGSVRF